MLLFKIGFMEIHFLDILDVILVGLLLFQVYKLLRGSLALNIFFGLLLVYLVWLLVRVLDMHLLEGILGQFIGVGVLALLIVFQPEIRRFLLFIGRGSIFRKEGYWRRFFFDKFMISNNIEEKIQEILDALQLLAKDNTGALIVFAKTSRLQFFANSGVEINGQISTKLLESIFNKHSPLHDGAVIISNSQVAAANCVLPVSENPDLPSRIGLRHRAAVGITDHSDALAVVVSEETGELAYALDGKLYQKVSLEEMGKILNQALLD